MPPYSKLTAFQVEQLRDIAGNPKATIAQRLRAIKHLDLLKPTSRKGRKRNKQNKLLGIVTTQPILLPESAPDKDRLLGYCPDTTT